MNAHNAADQLRQTLQCGTHDDLAMVPALLQVIAQELPQLQSERAAAVAAVADLQEAVHALGELIESEPAALPTAGPDLLATITALLPAAAQQIERQPQLWG